MLLTAHHADDQVSPTTIKFNFLSAAVHVVCVYVCQWKFQNKDIITLFCNDIGILSSSVLISPSGLVTDARLIVIAKKQCRLSYLLSDYLAIAVFLDLLACLSHLKFSPLIPILLLKFLETMVFFL